MAEKDNKGNGKPSLSSNPFLLPAMTSPSQVRRSTQSIYVPSGYGSMTSSTSTMGRSVFSGSSGSSGSSSLSSVSSSANPITAFSSGTYSTSAFKGYESSVTFSVSSVRPSTVFGAEGSITSPNTFPVFGGEKNVVDNSSKSFSGFQGLSGSGSQTTPSSFVFASKNPRNPDKQKSGVSPVPKFGVISPTKPAFQTTAGPKVFGELPSHKSAHFSTPVSESLAVSTLPSSSYFFGGVAVTTHSKSGDITGSVQNKPEKPAREGNVFGGSTSTSVVETYSGSSPSQFTSSKVPASVPSVFGGTSSAPGTVATVFGGSASGTASGGKAQSGIDTASAPNLFGGKDTTKGKVAENTAASSFGRMTSVSSSVPKLFGGIPSNPLESVISVTKPSSQAIDEPMVVASAVFVPTLSAVPAVFGASPGITMNAPETAVAPTSAVVPNVFGGKNDFESMPTVSTKPEPHSDPSVGFPAVELATSKTVFTSSESSRAIIETSDTGSSTSLFESKPGEEASSAKGFTTSTYVFGGPTTDASKIPALFGDDVFGGATKSKTTDDVFSGATKSKTTDDVFGGATKSKTTDDVFGGATKSKTTDDIFGGATKSETTDVFCGATKSKTTDGFGGATKLETTDVFSGATKSETTDVFGGATKSETTYVFGGETKSETTYVFGGATKSETTDVFSGATKSETTDVFGGATKSETTDVFGGATKSETTDVFGGATKSENTDVFGGATRSETTDVFGGATKSKTTEQLTHTIQTQASAAGNLLPSVSLESVLDTTTIQSTASTSLFGGTLLKKENDDVKEKKVEKKVQKALFGEPTSEETERSKQIDQLLSSKDLIDIFGRDDEAKNTSTTPTTAPPEYEKSELTKIIVAQIPESCMDKDIIKNHFKKFGHVKRVFLNPKSNQATVQYEDHKGASKAKRKGQKIHPNLPEVKIFYATPARRKSEEGTSDAMLSKKKAIKTLQHSHPVGDAKRRPSPMEDLDPYVPLDRPSSSDSPSSYLKNPSKREMRSFIREQKTSKLHDADKRRSERKQPIVLADYKISPRPLHKIGSPRPHHTSGSPRPLHKSGSPKITRMESPKSALLKLEDKSKPSSRPVSPAREFTVFTEVTNLKAALDLKTTNSNDRFTVLKARDKLMRNDKKKSLKATSLDAGCPDMCPEFERHMRDVQNDLSSYEVTNGILDHGLCVKKFSRSSADKEEPLPHELRPGPVLLKTMDYLVCNIIGLWDKEGIDIGIWYNYLWDRTRAIRSDITQQQLTDSTAVTIIERCVRFHIYAAVHLCEESSDVFDRKLNTENLTKSMQTLKELYKDLADQGKYFSSEAEFRAYEMLLNLNDGEKIVHQYSQYRDELQKSPDVTYALKVFMALKSNNFVRFFKLIKSGTYLQGCILHRYFFQVRSKGLDTFVKAYVVSKKVSIPLPYVIKTLGFEDRADAVNYLNYHGIAVDDKNVIVDKTLIDLHPEGQPPMKRPLRLIETNRLFSVAEVIQGGPVPENPMNTYVPHCSFDEEGYLKPDARNASDQQKKLKSLLSLTTTQPASVAPQENLEQPDLSVPQDLLQPPQQSLLPARESEGLSDHDYMSLVKDTYDSISIDVVSSLSKSIAKKSIDRVTQEHLRESAIKSVGHSMISECVKKEVKIIGKEAYNEVDREEKQRKKREEEESKRKVKEEEEILGFVAASLCEQYTNEFLSILLKQTCKESIREIEAALRQEVHASLLKELPSKLVQEVIEEEANELGSKVILEMTQDLEEKMNQLQQKIHLRKMREYFRKWRKVILSVRRRKEAQVTFPSMFSQLSIFEQNEALSWGYKRKLSENMSADSLLNLKIEDTKRAKKMIIRDQLIGAVAWYPLPLQQELEKIVETSSCGSGLLKHYFKVLLCTSVDENSAVLQWLRSKLIGVENASVEEKLHYSFSFKSRTTGLEYGCIFHESSLQSITTEDVRGTSAILFLTRNMTINGSGYKKIRSMIRSNPDVPYKIICEEKSSNESDESLEICEEDLLVQETSQRLKDIVISMWHKHAGRMQVISSPLINFASGFVASYYVQPSLLKQQERNSDIKSPLSPRTYINLYNAVIQVLIGIINDQEFSNLDWPPPELNQLDQVPSSTWNKSDVEKLTDDIEQIKLPGLDIVGFVTWKELSQRLHSYVAQVSQPDVFSVVLWSQIDSLLNNTSKILGSIYNLDFDDPDTEIHVLHLPWTELIYACVSYKLGTLVNSQVFYQPKRLTSFTYPREWLDACDYSDPSWNEISYDRRATKTRKRKAVEDVAEPSKDAKVPNLSSELLCDIIREKEKYLAFEKKLELALEDEVSGASWSDGAHPNYWQDNEEEEEEELLYQRENPVECNELLREISKEKQRTEIFQRKLENMLEDGEDLRFLFSDA